MAWSVDPASGRNWRDYYAGDATIDVLGWDAYNLIANKGRYDTPDHVFGKSIAVSKSVGKPYGFAEFGSMIAAGDSNGSGRGAWLSFRRFVPAVQWVPVGGVLQRSGRWRVPAGRRSLGSRMASSHGRLTPKRRKT